MSAKVVVPAYLPPLTYMAALVSQEKLYFRTDTFFQKQTYRNRAYVYGANGKLQLTIPIEHTPSNGHRKDTQIQPFNGIAWQKNHWKSLEAAYRSSPYFEFYETQLAPFYTKTYHRLFEFNIALIETLFDLIGLPKKRGALDEKPADFVDVLYLLNAKTEPFSCPKYIQVFESKYGFISNLSIVDALFNLGPETATYLKALEENLPPN